MAVGVAGCGFDRAPLQPKELPEVRGGTVESNAGAPAPGSLNGGPNQPLTQTPADAGGPADSGDLPDLVIEPVPDALLDAGSPASPTPEPDAGPGPPDATTEPPPPPRGMRHSRCFNDFGCDEGLTCYSTGPGHCADVCQENSDCVDHDGFDFTCSTDEAACHIDCSESGSDGQCPAPLTCVENSGSFRCRLPPETGTHDKDRFEICDRTHGNTDCPQGMICYRAADSIIDGPGYCTDACQGFSSCDNNTIGGGTQLTCNGLVCRFSCTTAPCPDGMECEDFVNQRICHYPPTP